MIFSTFVPYFRDELQFTYGDRFGSASVHDDLLMQSLKYDIVDRAELFIEGAAELSTPLPRITAACRRALDQLPEEFGRRVTGVSLPFLLSHAEGSDGHSARVFVTKVPEFGMVSRLRSASGMPFAICAIVHSAFFPNLFGAWLTVLCCARPCDRIVVTSAAAEAAVRSIIDQAQRGVGAERARGLTSPPVVRIPLGVDPEQFAGCGRGDAKGSLGLPPESIVIAYLGRLTSEYKADLEPLIRVFATIARKRPECFLLIAGSDSGSEYGDAVVRSARDWSCSHKIRLVTNFPRLAKAVLLSAADILVSPADNIQESFGLTVLEGMAAGLPVVASNWSGYRDLVVHGETGYLIDTFVHTPRASVGSAIGAAGVVPHAERFFASQTVIDTGQLLVFLSALVESAELRRQMGAAGRERVTQKFAWARVIKNFGRLWHDQTSEIGESDTGTTFVDYAEAFRFYPNQTLDLNRLLLLSSQEAVNILAARYGPDDLRVRLACQCSTRPVCVRDMGKSEPAWSKEQAILSLVKSGAVQVVAR